MSADRSSSQLPSTVGDLPRSVEVAKQTGSINAATLSRSQKAAIVLASLSADFATKIANELSDEELRAFAAAFSELSSIGPEALNRIAAEFVSEVTSQCAQLPAGRLEAQRVLREIVGSERVDTVFASVSSDEEAHGIWSQIEELDDEALLAYFDTQSSTICAVVLSQLSATKAASLISRCDSEQARVMLMELAQKPDFPQPAIDAVAFAIKEDVLEEINSRIDYSKGGVVVGEIVNFLSVTERDAMMSALENTNIDIARAVKKNVLTFSELHARLPKEAAPIVIREVDRRILIEALSYGNQIAKDTVDYFFASISKRLGEQIREEVEELGELDEAAGDAAHREFIAKVKHLASIGEIEVIEITDE